MQLPRRAERGRLEAGVGRSGLPPASGMAAIYPTESRLVPPNPASGKVLRALPSGDGGRRKQAARRAQASASIGVYTSAIPKYLGPNTSSASGVRITGGTLTPTTRTRWPYLSPSVVIGSAFS